MNNSSECGMYTTHDLRIAIIDDVDYIVEKTNNYDDYFKLKPILDELEKITAMI